jgi:hypothetical protein
VLVIGGQTETLPDQSWIVIMRTAPRASATLGVSYGRLALLRAAPAATPLRSAFSSAILAHDFGRMEMTMKFATFAAAAAFAFAAVSAPALAQDAGVAVGAKVFGPDGNEVGTIERVEGANAVVNTGTVTATLPTEVFGVGETGPTIGWNKAELEAAVNAEKEEAAAALAAALVTGTDFYSVDGVMLGKVESVGEDGLVVVNLATGPVSLPEAQFAMQAEKLTFLSTAADLEAAIAAQTGG